MINDGINDVPENTIAVFIAPAIPDEALTKDRILGMMSKPNKMRDWFDPHFYRCLPLTIGNQYGFVITSEHDFCFLWNGGNDINDISLYFNGEQVNEEDRKILYPNISSHFGHGIITINAPFFIRTPPGVNIMTMNPPNHIIPNITVMTGVVETDNLRRNFTFNLKIQMQGIKVCIPAGTPLAAFVPIPRYFADGFDLKFADEIFSADLVAEEMKASDDANTHRNEVESKLKNRVGKHYMRGTDVYGNKFSDHQRP